MCIKTYTKEKIIRKKEKHSETEQTFILAYTQIHVVPTL